MENSPKDYSHIKGWGIDADPKNDPTYPMKNRTNEEHKGYSWDRPTLQPQMWKCCTPTSAPMSLLCSAPLLRRAG